MEEISTSLLVLMGVQQVVHLLSLKVNPILDTSGLEYHLLMSAMHLSLYWQVRMCIYIPLYIIYNLKICLIANVNI